MKDTAFAWIEHVLNPKTITSIYPAQAPSLAQVRLGELSILCGGTLWCRLQFDLKDFPADAPIKWVQQQCNTVSLSLSLTNLHRAVRHFQRQWHRRFEHHSRWHRLSSGI